MVMSDEYEKLIKIRDSPGVFLHVYVLDFEDCNLMISIWTSPRFLHVH